MKKTFLFIAALFAAVSVSAQKEPNYDESKIPDFKLPELLKCENGKAITSTQEWEELRRPELLSMFSHRMYGVTPSQKIDVSYRTVAETINDLDGKAFSRQVLFTFKNGNLKRDMLMLLYYPNNVKGKAPVFLTYNYGNESITKNINVIPSPSTRVNAGSGDEIRRGGMDRRWPLDSIVANGFAVATMCYGDIYPDKAGQQAKDSSVMPLFDDYMATRDKPDSWEALGAWAWGFSRAMDYLETDQRVDPGKVIVMGHSRQGKAALWAGAQDPRFAIVISNESGCGGAALSKRVIGENVEIITTTFPHWFCENFKQYARNEQKLPFDQHQLIALIAPRPVYVASAAGDVWSDPKGEYLSAYYAGKVYEMYGKKGLENDVQPALHQPVMNDVGYHIREGIHDVTYFDWKSFMEFANKHFGK